MRALRFSFCFFFIALSSTVLIAEATSGQQPLARGEHVLGVCQLLETHRSAQPVADFSPVLYANAYYYKITRSENNVIKNDAAEIRIIRQPKHGKLELPNPVWASGLYLPSDGYIGNDFFVIQVTGNGHAVNINYFVTMVNEDGKSIRGNKNCKSHAWKISATPESKGLGSFIE